jgi:hypothetical protein
MRVSALMPKRSRSVPLSLALQRLGWLLDQLKQTSLADALHSPLGARSALPRTKLDAAGTWGGYPTQNRWRVVENASPQSDL